MFCLRVTINYSIHGSPSLRIGLIYVLDMVSSALPYYTRVIIGKTRQFLSAGIMTVITINMQSIKVIQRKFDLSYHVLNIQVFVCYVW